MVFVCELFNRVIVNIGFSCLRDICDEISIKGSIFIRIPIVYAYKESDEDFDIFISVKVHDF